VAGDLTRRGIEFLEYAAKIEFLELKQGDMSVTEYAAKFVELAMFYPHYTAETAEFSKCIKFENGLRGEIKRAIGYQKIRQFSELVSSCRIYEEDTKAHYKVMNERKGKSQQSRPKPYSAPVGKGKQKVNDEGRPRKKDTPAEIVCYTCGEKGHKSNASLFSWFSSFSPKACKPNLCLALSFSLYTQQIF